jgi:hypothetical protein
MRLRLQLVATALASVAALALLPFAARGASEDSTSNTASPGNTGGAVETDPHKQKLLREIEKTATPDAHHQALQPLAGKFDTQAKMWFGSKFPERTSGHDHAESILGGRFIEDHYDSVVWGKPWAGQGLIGFDEREQKYVLSWIDNWGTWITVAQGTADPTNHVITLTTRDWDNPSGKTRPEKFVITIDNEEHHWKRIYEKVAGKETLTLEIEYRRVK